MLAGDFSLGYMVTESIGVGVGIGFGGELNFDYIRSYSGYSLQARWKIKRFITVVDIGKVTQSDVALNDGPYYSEGFDKANGPFWKVKQSFRITRRLTTGLHLHHCPEVKTIITPFDSTMAATSNRKSGWYGFSIFFGFSFN